MDPLTRAMFMGAASGLPEIGDFYGGGYFAGYISHTADGNPTHGLILAPIQTGASGPGYLNYTAYSWKTTNSNTNNSTSTYDGVANTNAMVTDGITNHPAANFCVNLNINGYTDWYLPAMYELAIAYYNLKPTSASNSTSHGINDYSVPKRTNNYVNSPSLDPDQTSLIKFQYTSGNQYFIDVDHWSSTESSPFYARTLRFSDGYEGFGAKATHFRHVRAFRRFAL